MTAPRVLAWPVPAQPGQFQLGSLVMGAGTPYSLQLLEGMGVPDISAAEVERAGADGSFGGLDTMPKRQVIMHMLLHPDMVTGLPAKAILARNLKQAFDATQDLVGLTFNDPDLGQLLLLGRPRRCSFGVDLTRPLRSQDGVLAQFDALDPLIYSGTLQDALIAYGTAGVNAGLPFNASALIGMTFQPLRYVQNSGFEDATTAPWAVTGSFLISGAVLTRDTVTKHSGAASGKVVTNGASGAEGIRTPPTPNLINLLPNTTYVVTCWVFLSTAGGSIGLYFEDVTNGAHGVRGAPITTTGSWQQLTTTLTTGPTGPVTALVVVRDDGTAVARTFFVDDAQVDIGAVPQPYVAPAALVGAPFGAIGGGAGAAGFQQCTNNGNQPSQPVSKISALAGPVTGPLHLERVESGEVITLNYSMQPNDVLELDHDLHTVVLNGIANRSDIIDASTAWWAMQPGLQTIHYRTDGPGAGSVAEIKWRDAWL